MSYSLWEKFEQGSRAGPQWLSHPSSMFRNKVLVGKLIIWMRAFVTFLICAFIRFVVFGAELSGLEFPWFVMSFPRMTGLLHS